MQATARMFLLCAQLASLVVVLRRKPTRWFHVLRWDTRNDAIEHGSWFYGRLYEKRCDVSPDGQWLIYFASAQHKAHFPTWTGVSRAPWLKTVGECEGVGTWVGGGFWRDARTLLLNGCATLDSPGQPGRNNTERLPFKVKPHAWTRDPGDLEVLTHRFDRDWQPDTAVSAPRTPSKDNGNWSMRGVTWSWVRKPTPQHPALRATGPFGMQSAFRFALDGHPGFLEGADWCDYDALGQLVFSRGGALHRCTAADALAGRVTSGVDLEHLSPPARGSRGAASAEP